MNKITEENHAFNENLINKNIYIKKGMEKKQIVVLLACICLVSLVIRLYFAFSTPYFSDDTTYFHLRQIEYIKDHGVPLFYDPLSFSGRLFLFSPFFHYFFAALTYFWSTWYVIKILPNLLATMLIIIIYFLVEQITKNKQIAIFTASIVAFIPLYFVETVNAVSPRSLSIPLSFLVLYLFQNVHKERWNKGCIVLTIVLILIDPTALLLLFGLMMYIFLMKISGLEPKKEEKEFIFFAVVLALWFYLLLYKVALAKHGIEILWQNIPPALIDKYYYNITIISAIYHVGLVPLLFGLVVTYYALFTGREKTEEPHHFHEQHRKAIFPIIGVLFTVTVFMWFKIIEFTIGLTYLAILLVILSGFGYMEFQQYVEKTKLRRWSNVIFLFVFMIFVGSSVVPSLYYSAQRMKETITPKEVAFLRFLPEIAEKDAIIISLVDDGHYIEYFSDRKTVADTNFLQIKDAKQRLKDIDTLFTTTSKIIATQVMNKYNARYIYISPTAKKLYGIDYLSYEDNDCFQLLYVGDVRLYKSTCE